MSIASVSLRSSTSFKFFVGLFVVSKCVHFVIIVYLVSNDSHSSFVSGESDDVFVGFQASYLEFLNSN